ncbi:porin B [Gluconobacter sphaericus NBRC 12467]|uniref:Porin B n=2 Tax=Gluconobacter sphaericus TaxID=574987 RepID=A0AA37SMH9_9PROT|nr:carbohydrate porin [Gluconobacter sphaericus]GEB42976.1 porin B [Gluconobacter sphaericus NBRC 12467]MBS1086611.1 carbohydrate porin [Gluconobacter sphaericus]MBS1100493.1 carbohydrate porin [Gluconobacter sphaericus]QQX90221.1 carbohydrate porin [Gluconobacter sphaericus]
MGTFGQDCMKALLTACAMTAVLPGITATGYAQTASAGVVDGRQKAATRASTATMGTPQIRTKSISPVPPLLKPVPTKTGAEAVAKTSDTTESRFFPASFHDWLTQSTMTGDWGGWRTWLADKGINIGGHYLEDSAGNPMGGKTKAVRYADEFGINVDFNLKKLTGRNLGMFHTVITARQGLGLGATLPTLDSPQQIFGSGETVRLTRLSWEMPWNRYVSTEVGEINTENDFEQSSMYWGMSQYCQFESNAICGMPQSIAMNSGYGWYPTAHPGAWVKFYPAGNNHYLVQFGAYSIDPTISNTHNAWKLNLHDAIGTYIPFQLGWHQGGKDDYSGPLQTNVKIGGYWDTSEVSDVYSKLSMFSVPAEYLLSAPTQKVRGRFGGWFQFDRMLERDAADPNRGTTLFTSFTWGDPRTSVAPYFITWGVTRKGTFRNRPNDTISLGMKMLWVNPKLTTWARQMQASGAQGINKPSGEHAIELNYGWRPTPWLVVRPGAQYIWSAGGTNRYKNPLLLDFETGITF